MSALCCLFALFFPVAYECCPPGFTQFAIADTGDTWSTNGEVVAYGDAHNPGWAYDAWAYERAPDSGTFSCDSAAFGNLTLYNTTDAVCCYQDPQLSAPASFTNDWLAGDIDCGEYNGIYSFIPSRSASHYWRFTQPNTSDVTFRDCGSSPDPTLFLYDSEGNSLMGESGPTQCDGDDCANDWLQCSGYAYNLMETFSYPLLPAGTYYLRMQSAANENYPYFLGLYRISISRGSPPTPRPTPYPTPYTPWPTAESDSSSIISISMLCIAILIIIAITFIVYYYCKRKKQAPLRLGVPLVEAPVDVPVPQQTQKQVQPTYMYAPTQLQQQQQHQQIQTLYIPPQQTPVEGQQQITHQ